MDAATQALVAELGRKTSVCWLRHDGTSTLVWHAWHDDALCLVGGGDEQRLPPLDDGSTVEVVMRSKDTGGRQVTWPGRVSVVRPGDAAWPGTTAALVAARLNLPDPTTATDHWAAASSVLRLSP